MTRLLRALSVALVVIPTFTAVGAQDIMDKQRRCTEIVKSDMTATMRKKPDVAKTVLNHLFEYSPSRDTCVLIVQYKVNKPGKPKKVQVVAYNAVTMQPMEGFKNIFLEDAGDTAGIEAATNFLFESFSH